MFASKLGLIRGRAGTRPFLHLNQVVRVHIRMFTPLFIQLQYWFYPTGNTPAVNLLRDTPAAIDQQDTVNALLLACGDPRNVLFSLWNCQGSGRSHYTAIHIIRDTQLHAQVSGFLISASKENEIIY